MFAQVESNAFIITVINIHNITRKKKKRGWTFNSGKAIFFVLQVRQADLLTAHQQLQIWLEASLKS
jgi:hypothetical protein